MLIEHMSMGYPFATFAAEINVCRTTLYNWAKLHPEFAEAKRRGYDKAYRTLFEKGLDALYDKSFNTTAWAIIMNNMFWHRNKSKSELASHNAASVDEETRILAQYVGEHE